MVTKNASFLPSFLRTQESPQKKHKIPAFASTTSSFVSLFFCTIALTAFSSCKLAGLNTQRETPKKGYIYPHFTEKDYVRGTLGENRSCYNVLHYNINLDINPEKKHIAGYADIQFEAEKTLKELQIDLFKNLRIDSIIYSRIEPAFAKSQGQKLAFSRKYNAVFVQFPDSVQQNTINNLRVFYAGKPTEANRPPWEGGFVWKKSADGSAWFGVTCEGDGASMWFPCKDHLSDEPDHGMTLTASVPKGLTVVSNGVQTAHETRGEKEIFTWNTNYPINNYNITLYAGKFVSYTEEFKGIDSTFTLSYYTLPEHFEKSRNAFAQTAPILRFYETMFGPYPWANEGFKLIGSPYEGMEHQTAIAYGTKGRQIAGIDYIILHETAHEWFGNSVSVPDVSDIFIHEGFATYAEVLYMEQLYGKKTADKYLSRYSAFIQNKNPIVGIQGVNFWNYKDTDPYMKGAWTLHGLRFVVNNDSLFFDILHSFYTRQAYKITTVQDFITLVNTKTGKDLSWYFNQYLYKREVPVLEYYSEPSGKGTKLHLRWTNVDANFALPVEIVADGTPLRINTTTQEQSVTISDFDHIAFNISPAYFAVKEVSAKKFKKMR
ncbi:MAG: M1 family metallopeptidase [Bacteroidales bacterium]|jgi:aminopeptidase N|nr:M1 family metallopeptidase [Bacteroidales bacterium]